jgi:hypothetical protein
LSQDSSSEKAELSGTTLLVYWYLLKKRQGCGVREIQRALGFASSSSAHYHLDKLAYRNILIRDEHGYYRINARAKIARISPFILIQGRVFPMQLFYAIATTGMCFAFLLLFWKSLTSTAILALCPGILAALIFWYDVVRIWHSMPSFKRSVRKSGKTFESVDLSPAKTA